VFDAAPKLPIPNGSLDANASSSLSLETQEPITTITTVSGASPSPLPPRKLSMVDYATSPSQVSAFCRAVVTRLIPHGFWGSGETQAHNEKIFYRNVDRFITLRRFESLSLHEVAQGTKVATYLSYSSTSQH
jgi:telomerase reverse transcriptase